MLLVQYRYLSLPLALCLGCEAGRPPEPSRKLELPCVGPTVLDRPNGFQVLVFPDSTSKLARVDVRYPVGSAHDPEGKEGLAHLVAHLMYEFDVQDQGSASSLHEQFSEVSTHLNVKSTEDYIHFESRGIPDALPGLLRLETDRALYECGQIRPDVFEREKAVIVDEVRQRLGADGGDLRAKILAGLYPYGHPYRKTNSVASVSALTLEDVCTFMKDQFKYGRATVTVTGAVTEKAVRALISRTFDKIPQRIVDGSPRPGTVGNGGGRTKIETDVPEGVFIMAWPLPPRGRIPYGVLESAMGVMTRILESQATSFKWGHSASTRLVGGGDSPFLILPKRRTMCGGC